MAEKYLKLKRSKVPNLVPNVNQLDTETLVHNTVDGKWYSLRINENGVKEIVELGTSDPGNGESHFRAHQMDSVDDHSPIEDPVKWGMAVGVNSLTGLIEFFNKYDCDRHFEYSQGSPALNWEIQHNLAKFPSVTVTDSSGTEIDCEIMHLDNNNLILNFSEPFAGHAYLN